MSMDLRHKYVACERCKRLARVGTVTDGDRTYTDEEWLDLHWGSGKNSTDSNAPPNKVDTANNFETEWNTTPANDDAELWAKLEKYADEYANDTKTDIAAPDDISPPNDVPSPPSSEYEDINAYTTDRFDPEHHDKEYVKLQETYLKIKQGGNMQIDFANARKNPQYLLPMNIEHIFDQYESVGAVVKTCSLYYTMSRELMKKAVEYDNFPLARLIAHDRAMMLMGKSLVKLDTAVKTKTGVDLRNYKISNDSDAQRRDKVKKTWLLETRNWGLVGILKSAVKRFLASIKR